MTDIETHFELGVLGVGAIAEAIVTGLCANRRDAPEVLLSPRGHSRSRALAARHPSVLVAEDNQSVVSRSRTVLLAVRPQDAKAALRDVTFPPGGKWSSAWSPPSRSNGCATSPGRGPCSRGPSRCPRSRAARG